MIETKHHWLTVIIAVYLPVSFVVTYSMAVAYGHVEPGFPYISYTGTKSPESCVFGQLVNIGAMLAGIIIYIRYRQGLQQFKPNCDQPHLVRLNQAAFILGILSALGVSMVANFQVSNIKIAHYCGAFLAFIIGLVYMILQTIISYMSAAFGIPGNTTGVRRFRLGLCVADTIFIILLIAAAGVARSKFNNTAGLDKSKRFWSLEDPGYPEHVTATISEWMMAFVSVIYFSSYYPEFKQFRMKQPEVVYYNEEHQRTEMSVT